MYNNHDKSTEKRRKMIAERLAKATAPVTASELAAEFSVSRQIIVGDVAILRAAGHDITATSRGYVTSESIRDDDSGLMTGIIVCRHTPEQLRDELYTIVDFGAEVADVTIEHAIYGEICGRLGLSSRYDVDTFVKKVESETNSAPISCLTDGVHMHRIRYKDEETFDLIKASLKEKGILLD